mmetsp:Transcript_2221/g.14741  ORF Transcript_2221/g.14741 Transcript_2221/m.14741 type:complete len:205 (+) Transcript_2221:1047-1661(+)
MKWRSSMVGSLKRLVLHPRPTPPKRASCPPEPLRLLPCAIALVPRANSVHPLVLMLLRPLDVFAPGRWLALCKSRKVSESMELFRGRHLNLERSSIPVDDQGRCNRPRPRRSHPKAGGHVAATAAPPGCSATCSPRTAVWWCFPSSERGTLRAWADSLPRAGPCRRNTRRTRWTWVPRTPRRGLVPVRWHPVRGTLRSWNPGCR